MFVVDGVAHAGSPQLGVRVESAKVIEPLAMLVTFSTGEVRFFDAKPLCKLPAFAPLADSRVFERFVIDRGVVCWKGGEIDLSPETMYEKSVEYDSEAGTSRLQG